MAEEGEKLQISEAQVARIREQFWNASMSTSALSSEMSIPESFVDGIACFDDLPYDVIVAALSTLPMDATSEQIEIVLDRIPMGEGG